MPNEGAPTPEIIRSGRNQLSEQRARIRTNLEPNYNPQQRPSPGELEPGTTTCASFEEVNAVEMRFGGDRTTPGVPGGPGGSSSPPFPIDLIFTKPWLHISLKEDSLVAWAGIL